MEVLPLENYANRDRSSLEKFLVDCRETARAKGRFQVASISLRVREIDPLAVLESIFEPGEWHFYMEKETEDWALAGADEVVSCRLEGPERFRRAGCFIREVLDNTLAIGDLEGPFAGPHFFCGFTFFDRPGAGSPFPGAALFLPRWQVARGAGGCCAVANLRIEPDSPVGELAEKVWRAHGKFSSFSYARSGLPAAPSPVADGLARAVEVGDGLRDFRSSVERALRDIRAGRYRKIVLARALDLELNRALNPLHALNDLRMRYPSCHVYSLANGAGQSFIGASPERLLRVRDRRLWTEALAGSAPRGRGAADDACLGEELRNRAKDRREHALVLDSILRRLRQAGLAPQFAPEPQLLRLPNVQHLHTPITANLPDSFHLLDLLAPLHPTPAVGGTPRDAACGAIPELEPFDRGLYAGPIGWINARGEGEFTVAIRSALIDTDRARLFAGAGIVEGSDPQEEWNETELKFRSLREALL